MYIVRSSQLMAASAIVSLCAVTGHAQDTLTPAVSTQMETSAATEAAPQQTYTPIASDKTDMPVAAPTETAPASLPATFLPIGTVIEISVEQAISSKTNKTGDWFNIVLIKPIMLNDVELVPAGTPGRGQVVHAAKAGWGGKPGELILAARYLETPNGQIPLRAMKLGALGKSNEGIAFAAGLFLTPLPFAINGKSAVIESGYLATAKLATDLYQPGTAPAAPVVSATDETPSTTEAPITAPAEAAPADAAAPDPQEEVKPVTEGQ